MRIVITKLERAFSSSCMDVLGDDSIAIGSMEPDGDQFQMSFRCLDVRPSGFPEFGSMGISKEWFESLEPGKVYTLNIT